MAEPVLVDTGPLFAIMNDKDEHHAACVAVLRELRAPLVTCWPVLTETAWLLRRRHDKLQELLGFVGAGTVSVRPLDEGAPAWIAAFIERYRDLPAQLADASLMYLAERERIATVFTLDRRDFTVYRLWNGNAPTLIPG